MEVEVITAAGKAVSILQNVLAHVRCAIDGDAIGAAQIENGELPICLVLDLGMIA